MNPETLRVGDAFAYLGTTVTVLREREPHRDQFGQDQFKYWAKRGDTGAEGYMIFGFGAAALTPA